MKGIWRIPIVQKALTSLVIAYIKLITATMRWTFTDTAVVDSVIDTSAGAVTLFWHGRMAQAITCRSLLKSKSRYVMISRSQDGDFIAKAVEALAIPTIRGSGGATQSSRTKGGGDAFRQATEAIRAGCLMLITPDGPRGPNQSLPRGPIKLARAANCPVYLLGLAASPAITLKSWDRAQIPLPFSNGALVMVGPLWPAAHADPASIETTRLSWEGGLRDVQHRAEILVRGMPFRFARL